MNNYLLFGNLSTNQYNPKEREFQTHICSIQTLISLWAIKYKADLITARDYT